MHSNNQFINHPHEPWDKFPNPPYKTPHKGVDKPRVTTIADVFPQLDRTTIGWSPLLVTLKEIATKPTSYPPYNIVAVDDDVTVIQIAVAGFSKKEISLTLQDYVLKIEGKRSSKEKGEVVYQGIAGRNFSLELAVAEFWEIAEAKLEDGMLSVTFKKELPEEKKPKVIDIK